MGRPPTHGAPSFRFHSFEVMEMESIIQKHGGNVPPRELIVSLAAKFSNSPHRAGKAIVQMKQVWNWFQNRRYALRSKLVKGPGNQSMSPNNTQGEVAPVMNIPHFPHQTSMPSGHDVVRITTENSPMEFEGKSARDSAWYDVQAFLSHRYFETGNPEVLVRFVGFGKEEEEWLNVRKHVRQRSLPCESSECIVVLPGDLILCFQEGKEQALYFDAHVLDAQRRRHDVRGCRCRFLVRYDHDQSEEIVPLRKICRRPETDYRFQMLHSTNELSSASSSIPTSSSSAPNPNPFSSHTITIPTGSVLHPTLTSTSSRDPDPDPSLTSVSYPTPSTSVQNSIQVGDPEVQKIESDSLSASRACEASAQESIKNLSDASIIMEVKIEEGSIPKTCTEEEGEPMDVSTAPKVGND